MRTELSTAFQGIELGPHDHPAEEAVNRTPFMFQHPLAHHPLFDIARLARLAEVGIQRGSGDRSLSMEERQLSKSERTRRMLDNMAELGKGKHWLKISAVNLLSDEYDELLQSFLGQIEAVTGWPVRASMTWAGLDVFMNSPNLQVPYHFDHDSNFLMQIRGEKDVSLFDPNDRAVLTEAEIEDYYRGNKLAGRYRDELNGVGRRFHLRPGFGVHHPPLAPHLIRNGNEVSVSAAFYFILPRQERVAHVYQINHFLRKLSLHPRPPGQSRLSDWAKDKVMESVSNSHPMSYDERLYSGVNRVASAPKMVKQVAQLLHRH
jgi:hypothetical protein